MARSQVKIKQTAGRDALGEFAPEFAHLNDDILFGEVWSRNDLLSLRDRSIVTVVALMSQGLTDSSFKYHLESAKKNGVSKAYKDAKRQGSCKTPTKCVLWEKVGVASHATDFLFYIKNRSKQSLLRLVTRTRIELVLPP